MPVKHVHSEEEFKSIVSDGPNNNCDKLLLVDYSAEWCGPCKMIAPIFESLSNKYGHKNFLFVHVDVDECSDLAQEQGIRAMPTFVFYKNSTSTELARIQGADAQGLETKIKELGAKYKAHFGGEGHTLGGGGAKVTASDGACNLSLEEIVQISQANLEYSLSECCRVGLRFMPAVQGGVLAGGKPFLRINPSEKISKLRVFIDSLLELGGVGSRSYELHNSYPPGILDEDKSINEASVAGTLVVVKFL